jgi:cytidylate kinase
MSPPDDERRPVVAIDGPGGGGKSTVARRLARHLRLPYLETGAMYRALGLEVLTRGVDPGDEPAVVSIAESLDIEVAANEAGEVEILLEGEPLGERIRDEKVGQVTSRVAAYPRVRRRMVEIQQRVGRASGGVIEGRDIGTRVFPETPLKFFLDADSGIRAERRLGELRQRSDAGISLAAVQEEMAARDRRDAERDESPMRADSSYRVVDTTDLSIDQVLETILATIKDRLAEGTDGSD